jgi:NAD(P)-dependent dehydrogenase (short-subunit alcohol dehydrogenase family)
MNILVNGGSRGIGKEIVIYLSNNKDNQVLVTGRNKEALGKLVLNSDHNNIFSLEVDLSVIDNRSAIFKTQVNNRFDVLDILINSAGLLVPKEFMGSSNHEARLMMETNFFGPVTVIRLLKPLMKRGSHIVNIASMGGFQGSVKYKGLSYYSSSKAALACMSECLAEEFKEEGIVVNCLALGSVQTEMFEEAFPGYKAQSGAKEMAKFIGDFAVTGKKFFNGRIIPVALTNP